ncbi:hypothetical protein Tco_0503343, partial [Tanacetum coccineum]
HVRTSLHFACWILLLSHVEVLRMISQVKLQALADLKIIMYVLRSERFGIELCVELKKYQAKDDSQSAGYALPITRRMIGGRTGRGGWTTHVEEVEETRDNQGSNQGNPGNQNGDAINDNIQGDIRNVIGGAMSDNLMDEKWSPVQDMSGM